MTGTLLYHVTHTEGSPRPLSPNENSSLVPRGAPAGHRASPVTSSLRVAVGGGGVDFCRKPKVRCLPGASALGRSFLAVWVALRFCDLHSLWKIECALDLTAQGSFRAVERWEIAGPPGSPGTASSCFSQKLLAFMRVIRSFTGLCAVWPACFWTKQLERYVEAEKKR